MQTHTHTHTHGVSGKKKAIILDLSEIEFTALEKKREGKKIRGGFEKNLLVLAHFFFIRKRFNVYSLHIDLNRHTQAYNKGKISFY